MDYNFKKTAAKVTSLSDITVGREKIKTEDIIKLYPDGITLTEFDLIADFQGGKDMVSLFAFEEDSTKFFFGGFILKNIASEWVDDFKGDISAASNALKESGGVRVQFKVKKTKNGNNITDVIILD